MANPEYYLSSAWGVSVKEIIQNSELSATLHDGSFNKHDKNHMNFVLQMKNNPTYSEMANHAGHMHSFFMNMFNRFNITPSCFRVPITCITLLTGDTIRNSVFFSYSCINEGDAFKLKPQDIENPQWLFSDIICEPPRLLELVENWRSHHPQLKMVCTIKYKGKTDFQTTEKFRKIPCSRILHLNCNKHEVTWLFPGVDSELSLRYP